jgi:glutathione synthase
MRICFVVNSTRTQRPTYTTIHLATAAARRAHEVAFVSVDALSHDGTRVTGRLTRPRVAPGPGADAEAFVRALRAAAGRVEPEPLDQFDVVLLRSNPHAGGGEPGAFNPAVELGLRLRRAGVLVWNDPEGLLKASSKLYLAGFPSEIRPRTLVTRSIERVRAFVHGLEGAAVIKPLDGYGGQDVFYVGRGERSNLEQIVSTVGSEGHLIVQEYLPAAARGDKRVLLLGGNPIKVGRHHAVYKRMRPKGDIRNNIHVGGVRRPATLTLTDRRLCEIIRPRLLADGLYFVGVDIVGDKILEINVHAPGGIHNIDELYGIDVGAAVVKDLERQVALRGAYGEALPGHVIMRA